MYRSNIVRMLSLDILEIISTKNQSNL
uniref:Uncharacterized protein n=1 Tax=Rhizophora mucronata TaxID=61149 RepID=A0A2P2QTF5_RHIMU